MKVKSESEVTQLCLTLNDPVKSESEVTQLCLTLNDPMDYSLPGSSAHGIFPFQINDFEGQHNQNYKYKKRTIHSYIQHFYTTYKCLCS